MPTLIQGGTKEVLLRNFIRLCSSLDAAGQTVKLDLYEGMIHVFQTRLPGLPECTTAFHHPAHGGPRTTGQPLDYSAIDRVAPSVILRLHSHDRPAGSKVPLYNWRNACFDARG